MPARADSRGWELVIAELGQENEASGCCCFPSASLVLFGFLPLRRAEHKKSSQAL